VHPWKSPATTLPGARPETPMRRPVRSPPRKLYGEDLAVLPRLIPPVDDPACRRPQAPCSVIRVARRNMTLFRFEEVFTSTSRGPDNPDVSPLSAHDGLPALITMIIMISFTYFSRIFPCIPAIVCPNWVRVEGQESGP
jgi:hypothetical protein